MDNKIYFGNAVDDGRDFQNWFIGDLHLWRGQVASGAPAELPQIRSTPNIEVKWAVHPEGQLRPGGWAQPSPKTSLSVLIRGKFLLRFRQDGEEGDEIVEFHLENEGDYVLWREIVEHTWQALADSLVLTVRWIESEDHLLNTPVDL